MSPMCGRTQSGGKPNANLKSRELRLQDFKQNQLALGRASLALGPVMGNLGLSMRELGLISRPLQPMNHLESCIVEGLAG